MLIVNKTLSEVGFICEDYNGFTDEKEEEVAKVHGVYFIFEFEIFSHRNKGLNPNLKVVNNVTEIT